MNKVTKEILEISERIARNEKSWIPKKEWHQSKGKLHWWKNDPYKELDVLKFEDGWWVFYNNQTIHKKSFNTKIRALQSAKKFMKGR